MNFEEVAVRSTYRELQWLVAGVRAQGGMNQLLKRVMVVRRPSWAEVGQGAIVIEYEALVQGSNAM